MHVHVAGSLILDYFVGSSHSRHVQIISNSFNNQMGVHFICNSFHSSNNQLAQRWSSQSATGRQHWIFTAKSAATCRATLLPRRRVYLHVIGNYTAARQLLTCNCSWFLFAMSLQAMSCNASNQHLCCLAFPSVSSEGSSIIDACHSSCIASSQ